jgi:hypothetical protein
MFLYLSGNDRVDQLLAGSDTLNTSGCPVRFASLSSGRLTYEIDFNRSIGNRFFTSSITNWIFFVKFKEKEVCLKAFYLAKAQ